MFKIFRLCKFKPYSVSRHYRNQSKIRTHYDVLQIPQTASQKEIREAFIKLSKEMHPDIKGKEGHIEFVKVNEAYKVLRKELLRREYDMNLKCGYSSEVPSYPWHSSDNYRQTSGFEYYGQPSQFTSTEEFEQHINSQKNNSYYGIKGIKRINNFLIAFICSLLAAIIFIFQIISVNKRVLEHREYLVRRNLQYYNKFNSSKETAKFKTLEEQIQDFKSKVESNKVKTSPGDKIN